MSSAARPRRSAGTISYAHLLRPLSDSDGGDTSSDDNDDNNNTKPSPSSSPSKAKAKGKGIDKAAVKVQKKKDKGKGKAKAMSPDDDTDGSVFEAPAGSESSDAHFSADDTGSDNDGGDGDADDDEGSDDAFAGKAGKGGRSKSGGVGIKMKTPASLPGSRSIVRKQAQPQLTASRARPLVGESKRAQAPPPPPPPDYLPSDLARQMYLLSPRWEPPARWVGPTPPHENAPVGEAMESEVRVKMSQAWVAMMFGPVEWALQDMGWWKGKWAKDGMRPRWGGWYPEVEAIYGDVVTGSALSDYLPRNIYPGTPRKVDIYVKKTAEKGAELEQNDIDDDGDDEMQVDHDGSAIPSIKILLGPKGAQEEVEISRFTSIKLENHWPDKKGLMGNAGGPVFAMAWCPRADTEPAPEKEYLALSTQSQPHELGHAIIPCSSLIQIWSLIGLETLELEISLCIDGGEALDLQWCPKGGEGEVADEEETLGLLAANFSDGTLRLYAVPKVEDVRQAKGIAEGHQVFVQTLPVLTLSLPNTQVLSFAWSSHETIVAGCMNGSVAVWSVGDALRSGARTVQPQQYFRLHTGPIRALAVQRVPPLDASLDGSYDTEGEPNFIMTASYDGDLMLTDLDNPATAAPLSHERYACTVVVSEPYTSNVYLNDIDGQLHVANVGTQGSWLKQAVSRHRGVITAAGSSDHHPFVSVASVDGTCIVTNGLRSQLKSSHLLHMSRKLFRIDFNRKTGEYRMLDQFLPEKRGDRRIQGNKMASKDMIEPTGAWSPEISVLSTTWHPSIQKASLVASGMACGLFRVDWVQVDAGNGPEPSAVFGDN